MSTMYQGSVGNDEGLGNRKRLKSQKSEFSLNFRKSEVGIGIPTDVELIIQI